MRRRGAFGAFAAASGAFALFFVAFFAARPPTTTTTTPRVVVVVAVADAASSASHAAGFVLGVGGGGGRPSVEEAEAAAAAAAAAFGTTTAVVVPPRSRRSRRRRRGRFASSSSSRAARSSVVAVRRSSPSSLPADDGPSSDDDDDDEVERRPTTAEAARSSLAPFFPSRSAYALPNDVGGRLDRPTDVRVGRRIVGIGDVHGDLDALRSFLIAARVVDPDDGGSSPSSWPHDPIWTGGDAIVVQTGDVLDRGDDELGCFRVLASLARQAEKAGGALIVLYGNHEALNAAGLFQYANRGGNEEMEGIVGDSIDNEMKTKRWRLQFAGNEPSRWAAFEPGGILAEPLLSNMKVAVVIGRTCFVHAGITARHLREYGGVEGMNDAVRRWIVKAHHGENNNVGKYDSIEQIAASAQYRSRIATCEMPPCLGGGVGGHSPVWMREYHTHDREPKDPMAQSMIDEALNELGGDVRRMVMGHTPQFHINCALRGKAWRIDVGASRGVMGGTPEVLEIVHGGGSEDGEEDRVSVLTADGERVDGSERRVSEMPF